MLLIFTTPPANKYFHNFTFVQCYFGTRLLLFFSKKLFFYSKIDIYTKKQAINKLKIVILHPRKH